MSVITVHVCQYLKCEGVAWLVSGVGGSVAVPDLKALPQKSVAIIMYVIYKLCNLHSARLLIKECSLT